MKKIYLKPETISIAVSIENMILAGSEKMTVSGTTNNTSDLLSREADWDDED